MYAQYVAKESCLFEGRAEGAIENSREVARKMKNLGVDIATISQGTGLSPEEVQAL